MRNFRHIFTISVAIFSVALILMFSGCASDADASGSSTGTYSSDDFSAKVTSTKIEIYILGDHTKGLYWVGTWEDNKSSVTSAGDREALDASLMGSGSDTKDFTVEDGELHFDFTMMGSTTNVSLEKE